MKAFIDRVFKKRKQDAEQVKEQSAEQFITQVESVEEQATQASVEAIVQEKQIYSKPGHYFSECNCFKCVRWRNQNAKQI